MATRKQNDLETPRTYLRAALQAPTALSTRQKMTSGKYGVTREAGEQSRSSPKATPSHELTRARSDPSRARSHLPQEIALGHCCQIQLTGGSELIPHPAVPAVVLTEETIMVSSFANNRTLADIYLDARHLLFIFPSRFLHVSSSCFLHVFRVRYAGTENFASVRAGAGRLGGPCRGPACAAGGPVPLAGGCWISWWSRRADV